MEINNKSKFTFLLYSIFILDNSFLSQGADSIRTVEMDAIIISANKTEKPFVELTVPAKIISKDEIINSGHSRLSEIMFNYKE